MTTLILALALVGPSEPTDPDLLHHFKETTTTNNNHTATHLSLQVLAAGFDLWATKRCLDKGTCYEAHPIWPGVKTPYVRKSITLAITSSLAIWADLTGKDKLSWWITGLSTAFQVALGVKALQY